MTRDNTLNSKIGRMKAEITLVALMVFFGVAA
jgi:hypothetical protein